MPSAGSAEAHRRALRRQQREEQQQWLLANRPDLVERQKRDRMRRELPRQPRPDTAADIAKTHADDLWSRKQFREASIASCDELLRLLRLHHPERERAAA